MIAFVLQWIKLHGYGALFLALALGIIGVPFPDEWILVYTGHLVYKGTLLIVPAFAAALSGSMAGILLSYGFGRIARYSLFKKNSRGFLTVQNKVALLHDWLEQTGRWVLVFGYFFPGVRHVTAFAAGASRMRFSLFSVFAAGGAFIWTATFLTMGFAFGDRWERVAERAHHHLIISSLAIIAGILVYGIIRRKTLLK